MTGFIIYFMGCAISWGSRSQKSVALSSTNYVEDGIVKIKFVKSENNDTDLFTKNLSNNDFKKYTMKFMKDCEK